MVSDSELRGLILRARDAGAILRTKHDATDCIVGVSIGKVPGGEYRRLGEPGTGWMPPIFAAERLREIIHGHEEHHAGTH